MTKVYDQHDAAFARVSAYVILKDGERVATVALRFPADGAGRLYAYVHWLGCEMTRGYAGGGGYDKRTAAVHDAMQRIVGADSAFVATAVDDGYSWDRKLTDAGFVVLQAV